MKFETIYNSIINLWPEEIDISSGKLMGDEGGIFPDLAEAHDRIKKEVGIQDPWKDLMVWTMFQEFHAQCRKLLKSKSYKLFPKIIDKNLLKRRYAKNLEVDEWREFLKDYERS